MNNRKIRYEDALGSNATDKRIDILRRLGECGSISEAARSAGVSYKAAWQAVETLTNLAGSVLVEKVVGGAGGGGAQLTQAGHQLLRASDLLASARSAVIDQLNRDAVHPVSLHGIASLGLRTSMRNQLPCQVRSLRKSGPSIRVELRLSDGAALYSVITRESAQLLALSPGQDVIALCKATAVSIVADSPEKAGFNSLGGTLKRLSRGSRGGEASLQLDCGLQIVGFTRAGDPLRLRARAVAQVEESGVVIALAH